MRFKWQVKALLPVALVLTTGLLMFWVTISLHEGEQKAVLVVALTGAIVVCAVLLVVLAVLVQRPLVELQSKIARLRAGDLSVKVSFADRSDEIGQLGRNFNEMVTQLRESQDVIQRLHEDQISSAEHLVTLGELAAGLAHELRNPLAGIAGVLEIMARDLPVSSPTREVLGEARTEVANLNQFLSDLLACARPRAPEFLPADLNETIEHAVNLARQQVLNRSIQVKFIRSEDLPSVEHDVVQINQVLLNLLLNAIQSIHEKGEIRVRVRREGVTVGVEVGDTGHGIPPEHIGDIFRPFFTTRGKGTGLGLSLAQRVARGHGGRIEVTSTWMEGSQFTLWLPVSQTKTVAAGALAGGHE
jgi:signal transduction histidine kinase